MDLREKKSETLNKTYWLYLAGAVLLGFLVRMPGVFWGHNFPLGWYGHHVDEWTHLVHAEILINPKLPARWPPTPYPKGAAAHVAVPIVGIRALEGKLLSERPPERAIITTGRVVSVLYGTATILIVFMLARRLFGDERIGMFSAWIFALGGLHVTQSHFFLADVPALFWFLLGSYLLLQDFNKANGNTFGFLSAASFCFGVAFGIKIMLLGLPTLGVCALMKKPRLARLIQTAAFFIVGFVVVNLGLYSPYDLARTLSRGATDPSKLDWVWSVLLYVIEMPSIVSFPILALSLVGFPALFVKLIKARNDSRFLPIVLIFALPLFIHSLFVVFKFDHFARHLIPFIPWMAIAAAWTLAKVIDKARAMGLHPGLVVVPLFLYLGFFIYDGERVFIKEPRNEAAKWVLQNVAPGADMSWVYHGRSRILSSYKFVLFPDKGRPHVVVIEMHEANHYLSGFSFKNSFPRDHRFIFDCPSPERLLAFQELFRGESEYKEIVRFREGYFMPEYLLVDKILGNRSRNYVTEIVIFEKDEASKKPNVSEGFLNEGSGRYSFWGSLG
jgi:hypothetical protein